MFDKRFQILYCIPFQREPLEEATPFRLYSEGLLETSHLHMVASALPADVREIVGSWETIYRFRESRITEHLTSPIYLDSFVEGTNLLTNHPLRVVLSNWKTADAIDELVSKTPHRWIHITTSEAKNGRVSATGMTWPIFRELIRSAYLDGTIYQEPIARVMSLFKEITEAAATVADADLLYEPRGHNITAINEHTVYCFGVREAKVQNRLMSMERQDYVDAVLRSADEVFSRRAKLSNGRIGVQPYRLVLAVPSLLEHFYSNKFSKNNNLRKKYPTLQRFILDAARQGSYFYKVNSENLMSFLREKSVQYLTYISAEELRTFSAALNVFAASSLTPVIRVEPSINSVRPLLAKVAQLSRGNNTRRKFKTNSAAREASQYMKNSIAPEYLKLLSEPSPSAREGVKLVTDLPLEWLTLNELPLMMVFETSRATATPGNVNFEQLVVGKARHLSVTDFSEVLVIRSFHDDDPIRSLPETSIEKMNLADGLLPVSVQIVDVQSVDEFVEAWNAFDGAIVIFDGHGIANASGDGVGNIIIGGAPMNVWDLRERLHRNPPIVIMSACDTHAVDSGHASIGNAMIMLGAASAVATFLPVDARYSASFIARLLLRVANFIPLAASSNIFLPLTWRTVVTRMQRMSFITEITLSIGEEGTAITADQLSRVQLQANADINGGNPKWYQSFLENLSKEIGESVEALRAKISTWASLVDVMLYVQWQYGLEVVTQRTRRRPDRKFPE